MEKIFRMIPQDWEINNLETVGDLSAGGTPSRFRDEYWTNGTIPWLSSGEIKNNIITNTNEKITEIGLKESAARLFPKGTVLIAITGQGLTRGRTALLGIESSTNQSVIGIICKINIVDNLFLWYYLQSQYWKLRNISQGSNQAGLNLNLLKSYKIIIPRQINEQQKIASILSNVDSLILQTQKEIEQTKRLKKGLMQRLLTKGIGHTKFKKIIWLFGKEIEIPEEWERTTVSEIFQLKTGGTPSRLKPEYFAGDIPWVTSTDLNRSIITQTLEKITKQAKEKSRLKIFPKGTFVIATYGLEAAGTRGKCGILTFDATINQACMAFLPSEKMTAQFLFYLYLEYGERIAFNYAQGTKQQNLYPDTVKKIPLIVPSIKEQEKITCILSSVDVKINGLEFRKSKLETLKKGLMQKLLTGQIRVKV